MFLRFICYLCLVTIVGLEEVDAMIASKFDDRFFPSLGSTKADSVSTCFAFAILGRDFGNFNFKQKLDSVFDVGFRCPRVHFKRVMIVILGHEYVFFSDERPQDDLMRLQLSVVFLVFGFSFGFH
jgi:hypothetical protein